MNKDILKNLIFLKEEYADSQSKYTYTDGGKSVTAAFP